MPFDALTIIHGTACIIGLAISSYVLGLITFVQGEEWYIGAMFVFGSTIEVVTWWLGAIWNLDPQRYPAGFCKTSAILYNFGAFCMTSCGVTLTLTTWNAVWQARNGSFEHICRPWQIPIWLRAFFFGYPIVAVSIFAGLGLGLDAFGPEGLWICDVTRPGVMWVRLAGYGGLDVLVTIPAFLASLSSIRNLYHIHNDAELTASIRTYQQQNYGLTDDYDEKAAAGGHRERNFGVQRVNHPEDTATSIRITLNPVGIESPRPVQPEYGQLPIHSPVSTMPGFDESTLHESRTSHTDSLTRYSDFGKSASARLSRKLARNASGKSYPPKASDPVRAFSETDSTTDVPPAPVHNESRRSRGEHFKRGKMYGASSGQWEESDDALIHAAAQHVKIDAPKELHIRQPRLPGRDHIDDGLEYNRSGPVPLTTMVWKNRVEADQRLHASHGQMQRVVPVAPFSGQSTTAIVNSGRAITSSTRHATTLEWAESSQKWTETSQKRSLSKFARIKMGAVRKDPKLLKALWRIAFFDIIFTVIEVLAAITSIAAIVRNEAPTGYDTAFTAVVIGIWGPFIIFGTTPVILDHLMPYWRSLAGRFAAWL